MEIFWDGLVDALKDTLFIMPILYLAYLLVSYFSHNNNEKYSKILHKTKKAGPVIGSLLGCIPQCGFSSVMSQLYSKKLVTFGTLIAVFVATSDEAIPIMISKPEFIPKLLLMIGIKLVYAIIVGYLIDGIIKLFSRRKPKLSYEAPKVNDTIENHNHDEHGEKHIENSADAIDDPIDEALAEDNQCSHDHHCHHCHHSHEEKGGHEHTHSHCCARNIFVDALIHTAIISAYVLAATLIINLITGYCGSLDPLKSIFTSNPYIQILFASLIGLIPNCAASVFLVEMFMQGVIIFPALVAGLSAGAGVGLIVLFTTNYKKVWVNLSVVGIQYALAIAIGIIVNFIPIW